MKEVKWSGGTTAYWTYGPHDAPQIVMLHGYRGDHHGLERIAHELSEFHVIVPDLPGFGRSSPLPNPHDQLAGFSQWACEFLALVDPSGHGTLVGHSFGSLVASKAIASSTAPIAQRLVLINPIAAPPIVISNQLLTLGMLSFHRLAGLVPSPLGDILLRNWAVSRVTGLATMTTSDPALRRWIHRQHTQYYSTFHDRDSLLEAFATSMKEAVAYYAQDISIPTLLIAGEIDVLAPLGDQRRLLHLIPHARLNVIPEAGHLTHYEHPTAVASMIADFVQGRG